MQLIIIFSGFALLCDVESEAFVCVEGHLPVFSHISKLSRSSCSLMDYLSLDIVKSHRGTIVPEMIQHQGGRL